MTTTDDLQARDSVLAAARLILETERADLRSALDDLPPDDQIDGVARVSLAEVEAALGRLDAGTYGVCIECSVPISHERLAILPTTTTCVSCRVRAEGEISAVDGR